MEETKSLKIHKKCPVAWDREEEVRNHEMTKRLRQINSIRTIT